jgi:cyclic pyranopterin phosphate synthase
MPKEVFGPGYQFLPKSDLLTFEEITNLVQIFTKLGVQKVRLTGGEPLLRQELVKLVAMLSQIPNLEIALTTNGSLLAKHAQNLKNAGLNRVTISLDSLNDEVFKGMNDVQFPVSQVLESIDVAYKAGLTPIKINMVVKRGVNDHTLLQMAKYFHNTPHILRFIEYMDVGSTNHWQMKDVVTAKEIIKTINSELPIEPIDPNYTGEVANRWRYKDGGGEIGLIASVTNPFCGDCSRLRLSARGQLFTCLFATHSFDLRKLIRSGAGDDEITNKIINIWGNRVDQYSEIRSTQHPDGKKVEMSYIGG